MTFNILKQNCQSNYWNTLLSQYISHYKAIFIHGSVLGTLILPFLSERYHSNRKWKWNGSVWYVFLFTKCKIILWKHTLKKQLWCRVFGFTSNTLQKLFLFFLSLRFFIDEKYFTINTISKSLNSLQMHFKKSLFFLSSSFYEMLHRNRTSKFLDTYS